MNKYIPPAVATIFCSTNLTFKSDISLLNVKFVLQKIVATAGGIYLFMNAFFL